MYRSFGILRNEGGGGNKDYVDIFFFFVEHYPERYYLICVSCVKSIREGLFLFVVICGFLKLIIFSRYR